MTSSLPHCFVGLVVLFCFAGCGENQDFETKEFTNLSGALAKMELESSWPEKVDADDVNAVDHKSIGSDDFDYYWFRISLSETAASKWIDAAHREHELWCKNIVEAFTVDQARLFTPEGVRRGVYGIPAVYSHIDQKPAWWTPPPIKFRSTEVMLWEKSGKVDLAMAAYTGFDESNSILWIVICVDKYTLLWKRGRVPEGDRIDFSAIKAR